jgi:spore coat protein U-like protein
MNIKTKLFAQLLYAGLLWCASQSLCLAADSQLQLEVANVDWRGGPQIGYNVFDPGEYAQTIYFKVHLTGNPVAFFVTFNRSSQGGDRRRAAFGSDSLEYQVYQAATNRTVLKDLPAANANEVLLGTFGLSETMKELSYAVVVPPEQIKPAGRYSDQLKITVYQGTLGNFVEKDSKTVNMSVLVNQVAEMAVVNSGAPFDPLANSQRLEFGELAKGKAKGVDLIARSNAGYQILLESESGGVMEHTDPRVADTIPYVLYIGGSPVNLRGGRQTALSRYKRVTDRKGDRHEVSATIGNMDNATAGTYRDNITVTIISDN